MDNETVTLQGIPCFDYKPIVMKLAQTNFIYGSNGTGKSSIALKLSRKEFEPNKNDVSVELFNQDYVHRIIDPSTEIDGVFTLRSGGTEVQKRLVEIEGDGKKPGLLDEAISQLSRLETTRNNNEKKVKKADNSLKNMMWELKDSLPDNLRKHAFTGLLNKKESFIKEVKKRYKQLNTKANIIEIDILERKFKALKGSGTSEIIDELEAIPIKTTIPIEIITILKTPFVQDKSNPLSDLSTKLSHADWVRQGIDYIEKSEGICPFCQQKLTKELINTLNSLFDVEYQQAKQTLSQYAAQIRVDIDNLSRYTEKVERIKLIDTEALRAKLYALQNNYNDVLRTIEKKLEKMGDAFELKLNYSSDEVNQALDDLNSTIRLYKQDLADKKHSLSNLKENIWLYFLKKEDVSAAYHEYIGEIKNPNKALINLESKIKEITKKRDSLQDELLDLRNQLTSTQEVMQEMNEILKGLGFSNFSLKLYGDKQENYQLVRSDGSIAERLSEGEKTLISFLYFYYFIKQKARDKTHNQNFWVIIDDPISSLDSQTLLAISHLCRELASLSLTNDTTLSRFFLFTHNAYFYHEVIYLDRSTRLSQKQRLYGLITKNFDGKSNISITKDNKFDSIYNLLWRDIQTAKNNNIMNATVQNSMRRIIEDYFMTINMTVNHKLISKFKLPLQLPAKSLLSWINDGSHKIRWDLDFAATSFDSTLYFEAFKQIFNATGQIGHYDAMMNPNNVQDTSE